MNNNIHLTENDDVFEGEIYGMEFKGQKVLVSIVDVMSPNYVYVHVEGSDSNVYTPITNLYHV